MNWPKKILVYLDSGSDIPQVALDEAIRIAKTHGASLRIVEVDEPPVFYPWSDAAEIETTRRNLQWEKESYIEAAVEKAVSAGCDASGALLEGKPYIALIREAQAQAYDLLIKTMMRESETVQRLFGTTAKHLLRKCPCPVLLVKPGAEQLQRIVVALGPVESEEQAAFNTRLLQTAGQMAQVQGATLSIVHAWELYGENILSKRMSNDEVDARVQEGQIRIEEELVELVNSALPEAASIDLAIEYGAPQEILSAFVTARKADLLVMGTVARSGLQGLLIGNTAESVTDQVTCSVLALKPDGFISPVAN